jgi:hypothetical protein
MDPADNTKCTPQRDERGLWLPGSSGNPNGRKKGQLNRQLAFLRNAVDDVLPIVASKAMEGDEESIKLLLAYGMPKLKAVTPPEEFNLPDGDLTKKVQAILQQVANGDMSASTGSEVVGMVAQAAKVEETDRLRQEIETLKAALRRRKVSA